MLGMHRSGTSALAGLLARAGLPLGPKLMAGQADNESGYWEHEDAVKCHDELLAALSTHWSDPCPLPLGWTRADTVAPRREELAAIIRRDFSGVPLWGIKDPRMCRLLPLWLPLLRELDIAPAAIFVVRHPAETALSLEKRNGFSLSKSLLLWLEHALAAERDTRGLPRAFIAYDDLFADPAASLARIGTEIGIAWPVPPDRAAAEFAAFLDPAKRHHRAASDTGLPAPVRDAYHALLAGARGESESVAAKMDAVHAIAGIARELYAETLRERGTDLQRQLDEQHEMFTWQISVLQANNRSLWSENRAHERRVKNRNAKIAHLSAKLEKETFRLLKTRDELAALRASWGWTVSKPVRQLEKILGLAPKLPARPATPRPETTQAIEPRPPQPPPAPATPSPDPKTLSASAHRAALDAFLASGARLAFDAPAAPAVSILIVLFNRAELTYACLRSLRHIRNLSFEVVLVDNASEDATPHLLDRLDGPKIARNTENRHFLEGTNQAAALASGKYLLLLNSDAELLPGSLEAAIACLESEPRAGAVGAKLILPDGSLQEAGSIVWRDGSCQGYGRSENPAAPQFQHRRDVDYCSGAFLLTPRALFQRLGGFSETYKPAYYEETDFCMRIWEAGLRVIYEPGAAVLHHEFASSIRPESAVALQQRNQTLFAARHADALRLHLPPGRQSVLLARSRPRDAKRILFIEDRIPHAYLGSGFPRSNAFLRALRDLGCAVTLFPFIGSTEEWADARRSLPRDIEVLLGLSRDNLAPFLAERPDFYGAIIVSRPHNMAFVKGLIEAGQTGASKIIYDAEAVFSVREIARAALSGKPLDPAAREALLAEETGLCAAAHALVAVSEHEKAILGESAASRCAVVGHRLDPDPCPAPFEARSGFLFAGAIHSDDSPNADSLLWFAKEILPLLRARGTYTATAAGVNESRTIADLSATGLTIAGPVPDLDPLFDRARVFIAPTRFAAGIPLKVLHAAAKGLPVVATPLIASQLGWTDREELLVAATPEDFAARCVELHENPTLWSRIRQNALAAIARDCSEERFHGGIRDALRIAGL